MKPTTTQSCPHRCSPAQLRSLSELGQRYAGSGITIDFCFYYSVAKITQKSNLLLLLAETCGTNIHSSDSAQVKGAATFYNVLLRCCNRMTENFLLQGSLSVLDHTAVPQEHPQCLARLRTMRLFVISTSIPTISSRLWLVHLECSNPTRKETSQ